MYKTRSEAVDFLTHFLPLVKRRPGREIVLCPSFPVLEAVREGLIHSGPKGKLVKLGAQNAHWEFTGAYTGEVSVDQLKELGCEYVILGHSERRRYSEETDEIINKKVFSAVRAHLTPLVCVGENAIERRTGKTQAVLKQQLRAILAGISQKHMGQIMVAYEPVWAIGTGTTPSVKEIEDAHDTIRQTSGVQRVLYGGSVNRDSLPKLLASKEIDGFLAGSASLDPDSLAYLVNLLWFLKENVHLWRKAFFLIQ